MPLTLSVAPTRLAIFALERGTALPIARLPVYAEIVVRSETEEPAISVDDELKDPIVVALRMDAPENIDEPQPRQRLVDVIGQEIARQLGSDAAEILRAGDPEEFILEVIRRVRGAFGGVPLRSLDRDTLRRAIRDAIREEADKRNMRLEPLAKPTPTLWAYPLGVLATDHTGYLSYDLSRLPATVRQAVATAIQARRLDPTAVLDLTISIYPTGLESMVFDVLSQGRFTSGAIVGRLEIAKPLIPYAVLNLALPAMQSPSLDDWRLSPGSFATNPGSLVGADGCESILPANVSLQEFYLYQVVRLTDVTPPVAPVTARQVQLGVINEYRVAWHSLGHSLGQILYSLPLAPGESVNLAVVDWTRRDEAQRKERTTVDEQLIHNEHRDRVISETVDAAVREYQRGSSFMGGIAGSVGASFGGFVSAGIAGSLGGSTSNSSGTRNVAATTVQKVSDNITQLSSASRELRSTVVVQSAQSEKETIETRTVANYNHSHALTILYYEVLRHFRVSTELVRRRPAVLVKIKTDWFTGSDSDTEKNARVHRKALESALLDPKVAAGFDALDRFEHRRQVAAALGPPSPPPPPPAVPPLAVGDREFDFFTFEMKTGGMFTQQMDDHGKRVEVTARLIGFMMPVQLLDPAGGDVLNQRGSFRQPSAINTFVALLPLPQVSVRWSSVTAVVFFINPQGDDEQKVSFEHIKVIGTDFTGATEILIDQNYSAGHLIITDEGANIALPIRRPPSPPPPPPPPTRPAEEIEDEVNRTRLLAHLKEHTAHYSRAIYFSREGLQRAAELDAIKLADGSNVLEKVENRPIDVIGDYVAFPGTDTAWKDRILASLDEVEPDEVIVDERLVALSTRGVFAEAMLGHCNASELIDNTRFWDWQQSPIPRMAPEIAPITAVTPQPQQPNLNATPLPASIVNIVNPPNAPDPTGMSAALNLLATPNIFRDMSGRAETADILKNLADNAVKIAAIATGARAGQSGSGGSGTGGKGVGGPRAMPNQPSATNRDLQDLGNVLGRAQADNLITPEDAQSLYTKAAQDAHAPSSTLAFSVDAETAEGAQLVTLNPIHADELEQILISYQFRQFAIFVPQPVLFSGQHEIGDVNVHIFFAAGGVQGEHQTDYLLHGLRGASNQSDWVTIALPGIRDSSNPISEAEIIDCLRAVEIKGSPKALRLSGHSRGTDSLMASITPRKIKNLALIDRVTFLDEAVEHAKSDAPNAGAVTLNRVAILKQLGVPAARMVSYEVGNRSQHNVTKQSARVAQATYVELGQNCMAAVGCVRLIQDAVQVRPDIQPKLDAKPKLKALVDSLPLPPRGSFTTKGAAGKIDFSQFCQDHAAEITAITSKVGNANESVLAFVNAQNLTSYAPRQMAWGIAWHHLFVAEIAHELTD